MGYGTRKTKKYLLQRVRLFIGESLLQIFTKIYEDLNLLVMNMNEKR